MGKFVSEELLNQELSKIIEEATESLILMSPYIKLNEKVRDRLLLVRDVQDLEITIVFGRSQRDKGKSLSQEDLEFLKQFPNVQIRYLERLHAKYYANETSALLTSMNLHDYTLRNDIEFGIVLTVDSLFDSEIDGLSTDYFEKVIRSSEIIFERKPVFSEGSMEYEGSHVYVDKTGEFFFPA